MPVSGPCAQSTRSRLCQECPKPGTKFESQHHAKVPEKRNVDDCGSYRWYVKTLTDKDGPVVFNLSATNSTLEQLINETRPLKNFESDPGKRYQDEHRKVRINVTIAKIKMETQHKPTGSALNQHEVHPITKITFK